jgi:hypothetical protein
MYFPSFRREVYEARGQKEDNAEEPGAGSMCLQCFACIVAALTNCCDHSSPVPTAFEKAPQDVLKARQVVAPTSSDVLEFLRVCGKLKRTLRTGWVNRKVKGPESVADHSYRMSLISLLVADKVHPLPSPLC